MKFKFFALAIILAFTLMTSTVVAQEGEMQVIDEVVAQVNDDVITLSMLKREIQRSHRSSEAERNDGTAGDRRGREKAG